MKKILLIYNPNSGTRKSARYLSQVLEIFTEHGATTTALPTLKRGDAKDYVMEYGPSHDVVVAMGGEACAYLVRNAFARHRLGGQDVAKAAGGSRLHVRSLRGPTVPRLVIRPARDHRPPCSHNSHLAAARTRLASTIVRRATL